MRKLAILLLTLCIIALTRANDSVYLGSGNQLVPLNENDIAITREVLTIDLTDDGRTRVDVLYELWNRGPEKTVLMGFEADAPSENGDAIAPDGKHPYIHNFHVTLNNKTLAFRTAGSGVALNFRGGSGFKLVVGSVGHRHDFRFSLGDGITGNDQFRLCADDSRIVHNRL